MACKADSFKTANRRSPVVSGAAIGNGGQGAHYVLANGLEFTLTRAECEQIGMPRWATPRKPASKALGQDGERGT